MKNKTLRNSFITVFVIIWTLFFHYQSTRAFYLEHWLGKPLPAVRWLFPPAGWIMFYHIDNRAGNINVYGVKKNDTKLIDPHDIFRVRTIGYDNFHRGIMFTVAMKHNRRQFCSFMFRRFPYFDRFIVEYEEFPDIAKERYMRNSHILYNCYER